MHESELRMQSYGKMNIGIWIWESRGLSENYTLQEKSTGRSGAGRGYPGRGKAFG